MESYQAEELFHSEIDNLQDREEYLQAMYLPTS